MANLRLRVPLKRYIPSLVPRYDTWACWRGVSQGWTAHRLIRPQHLPWGAENQETKILRRLPILRSSHSAPLLTLFAHLTRRTRASIMETVIIHARYADRSPLEDFLLQKFGYDRISVQVRIAYNMRSGERANICKVDERKISMWTPSITDTGRYLLPPSEWPYWQFIARMGGNAGDCYSGTLRRLLKFALAPPSGNSPKIMAAL